MSLLTILKFLAAGLLIGFSAGMATPLSVMRSRRARMVAIALGVAFLAGAIVPVCPPAVAYCCFHVSLFSGFFAIGALVGTL